MPAKFMGAPHPALLPLLVMLSHPEGDLEKVIDDAINMMQSTKSALQSIKGGMEIFHASMAMMTPPPAAKPAKPASWSEPAVEEKEKHPATEPEGDSN